MKKIIISGILIALALAGAGLAMDNPEERVTGAIKDFIAAKYPGWDRQDIVLTYKQAEKVFAALRAYSNAAKIEIMAVMPDFKPVGSVIFPLRVSAGGKEEKLLLRTRVEVFREIVVAARAIKRGEPLTADRLKLERRDIALLPAKYFAAAAPLLGQEAKISIPANSTIFDWMVGGPPLVRRGAAVTITVGAPGLAVKAKGEALEDGQAGQEIKVKRLDSSRVLKTRVKSENEVEVSVK
jgi:flagella basal body P-ring formation protein FlgA